MRRILPWVLAAWAFATPLHAEGSKAEFDLYDGGRTRVTLKHRANDWYVRLRADRQEETQLEMELGRIFGSEGRAVMPSIRLADDPELRICGKYGFPMLDLDERLGYDLDDVRYRTRAWSRNEPCRAGIQLKDGDVSAMLRCGTDARFTIYAGEEVRFQYSLRF